MAARMRRDPETVSPEEREAIMAAVHAGLKLGKRVGITAREHGITEANVYRWERERAREAMPPPSPPARPQFVSHPRTCCNHEDRERLIPQIRRRLDAGATVQEATGAVGVSEKSWYRWMRMAAAEPETSPTFRPVEISPEPAEETAGLRLVTPWGYRLEGLSVEAAVEILRALG